MLSPVCENTKTRKTGRKTTASQKAKQADFEIFQDAAPRFADTSREPEFAAEGAVGKGLRETIAGEIKRSMESQGTKILEVFREALAADKELVREQITNLELMYEQRITALDTKYEQRQAILENKIEQPGSVRRPNRASLIEPGIKGSWYTTNQTNLLRGCSSEGHSTERIPPEYPTPTPARRIQNFFCTIDLERAESTEDQRTPAAIREGIERTVRNAEGNDEAWRCTAVIKNRRHPNRIRIICKDENEL